MLLHVYYLFTCRGRRPRRPNVATPFSTPNVPIEKNGACAVLQDARLKAKNIILAASCGFDSTKQVTKKQGHYCVLAFFGDPYGNRTHVSSVRG